MAAPRKYSDELRDRVTRMALDARRDPATQGSGGIRPIRVLLALTLPLARLVLGTEWFVEVA